jgi:thiamine-monophosphate kinase
MNEFDIIKNYFATQIAHRTDVIRGIGDDAAIVSVPQGQELAITTDTLIAGIHFPDDTHPYDIGYKSLAVNLSDLAAMGATPAWVTLAMTLPKGNESIEDWIQAFCDGFFTLANRYQVQLIGGDLTHGPLSITVQALGLVPTLKAILRRGAKPSDLIYVSGTLGDAGLALQCLQKKIALPPKAMQPLLTRLNRPEPRVVMGEQIRGIAHAAIDISDGLAADLSHILEESQVGAIIYVDQLPLSEELKHSLPHEEAITLALTAGDDYELCFTIPADKRTQLENKLSSLPCRHTCIGTITEQTGLDLRYQNGNPYHGPLHGYRHF